LIKPFRPISIIAVIAILNGFFLQIVYAEQDSSVMLDMVIASIDGEPLTESELRQYIKQQGSPLPVNLEVATFEASKYLRDMIVETLLEREAEQAGIQVSEEEIQAYINEVRNQNNLDEEGFEKLLKQQNLTFESYKKEIKQDIVRTRLIGTVVRSKVHVVDEDIDRFLEANPQRMPKPGSVRVHQIIKRFSSDITAEDKNRLREELLTLRDNLHDLNHFRAQGGSDYIDLGYIRPSELREEFRSAINNLKDSNSQVSDVIETDIGFVILMVSGKPNKEQLIDGDLRDEIRQEIYEAKLKERLDAFLNDELPSKYHVEIKL
jgi:peptidyl-prolyl cis-trans isomerase SurA